MIGDGCLGVSVGVKKGGNMSESGVFRGRRMKHKSDSDLKFITHSLISFQAHPF